MPNQSQLLQVVVSARDEASKVFRKIKGEAKGFSSQLKGIAKTALPFIGLAGAGFAVSAGFKAAIGGAMEFEKQMSNVATLIDTSTESIEKMGKDVLNLSKVLPIPINELTDALYQVRSAGIDAGNAMAVLKASGQLAVTGLGTTTEATNLLTTAYNNFADTGKTANEIANILFKTVKAGKTTVRQLSIAFGNVAPIAKAAGVSLEELQAATAALTTVTGKTGESQQRLRALFDEMTRTEGKLAEATKKVGIENISLLIKSNGLKGALTLLYEAVNKNDIAFKNMFSSVEAGGAALLLVNAAAESYDKTLEDLSNGINEIIVAFQKQTETASAQYQLFKNNLNTVMMELGTKILPHLVKAMLWVTKVIGMMTIQWDSLTIKMAKVKVRGYILGAAIRFNKDEVNAWKEALVELDKEFLQVAEAEIRMQKDTEILEKGIEEMNKIMEEAGDVIGEVGEDIEGAFEDAGKSVADIKEEIKSLYEEITSSRDTYNKGLLSEQGSYEDEVVKLVADTEREIEELRKEKDRAIRTENAEDLMDLNNQIRDKEGILRSFINSGMQLEDELSERRNFLQMNELEQLKFNHQKKLLMMQKEQLQEEIRIASKLVNLQKGYDASINLIDKEQEAFTNAEVQKTEVLNQQLEERGQALKGFYAKMQTLVNNTVSNPLLSGGHSPLLDRNDNIIQMGGFSPLSRPINDIGSTKNNEENNTFNFNFSGALIGDINQFTNTIIDKINRQSELKALGGQ